MGWEDRHLYEFRIGDARYTAIEAGAERDSTSLNTESVYLRDLRLKKGDSFSYVYDFGDYWRHEILLEETSPADAGEICPLCTGGSRACPPEDCGGLPGYEEVLEAIGNAKHPEHKETKARLGSQFDPALFDKQKTNDELRKDFPGSD